MEHEIYNEALCMARERSILSVSAPVICDRVGISRTAFNFKYPAGFRSLINEIVAAGEAHYELTPRDTKLPNPRTKETQNMWVIVQSFYQCEKFKCVEGLSFQSAAAACQSSFPTVRGYWSGSLDDLKTAIYKYGIEHGSDIITELAREHRPELLEG